MNQVEQNCEIIQSLYSLNSGCSDSHSKSGKNLTHHFLGLSHLANSIFSALSLVSLFTKLIVAEELVPESEWCCAWPGQGARMAALEPDPLLDLPPISSLPPRTLPSEADYLCLLNGNTPAPCKLRGTRENRRAICTDEGGGQLAKPKTSPVVFS